MSSTHEFRDPVFRINNVEGYVEASVIVWGASREGQRSVKIANSSESILIPAEWWPLVVASINFELEKTS